MSVALYIFVALVGLVVGSFLNVVIWRVPRGESIVSPPSACPNCHHEIGPLENVPVVSWVALRGKCRHCGARISAQYPLVEAATAIAFVGVLARLGHSWAVPAYCALMAGMLALAWIDAQHHRLPKGAVWILTGIVAALLLLATAVIGNWHALLTGALCALGWSGVFFAIFYASPRLIGFGDVRFAVVLGLALGWISVLTAVAGFFLANVIGLIVTLTLIAMKRTGRSDQLPYGVYLAAGTAVIFYFGPWLLKGFPST